MKALVQRVKNSKVEISGKCAGEIKKGLLVLLGIAERDSEKDIDFLVEKISNLRIFEDENQKMNLSLLDIKGEVLIISQFTLYADCKKGRRPSFISAANPAKAEELYTKFVQKFKKTGLKTEQGQFGAMMDISLINWGPVTIMLDSTELIG